MNRGLAYPGYLNDLMQAILDDLCPCLENTTLGAPGSCFISHTSPPDDCCDFLALWVDRILPTFSFPLPSDRVEKCGDVHRMAEMKLRLVRSCWPVVRDSAVAPFPPPEAMQQAAEALLIDANVLWCCLLDTLTNGPGCGSMGCLDVQFTDLVMDEPRGGCAGMTMRFLVELDGCC